MKTFIADIIPRIQKYSQKLDNITLLTNQHWVVVDEITNSKTVYIFRPNNELLISKNGKVEKAKWEYVGQNTLLIDTKEQSYLFRHGFFDENILALKVDGKAEYAFLVNESKFSGDLDSGDRILEFLQRTYIESSVHSLASTQDQKRMAYVKYKTKYGILEIEIDAHRELLQKRDKVFLNGRIAPDGKYRIGSTRHIWVKSGVILKFSFFGFLY